MVGINLATLGSNLKKPESTTPATSVGSPVVEAKPALATLGPIGTEIRAAATGTAKTLESSRTAETMDVAVPVPQVIEGPEHFKEVLNNFDSYAAKVMEYDELTIPMGRRYVQTIMIALKTNPEYDGILVAQDVHNVMRFIRASKNMTEAAFVVTNKKREARAAKKKSVFDSDMLGDLSIPSAPTTRQAKQRKPNPFADTSLDDFAALNTDSIDTKLSRDDIK